MFLSYEGRRSNSEIEDRIKRIRKVYNPIKNKADNSIFIKGDNLIGMSMLLNDFEGKIDLFYIDPPFNTNSKFYFSEDEKATISVSRDNIIAYEDNMQFTDYMEFIRIRLVLIYKLLSNEGTLYFHIDCKVGHYIKIICDEIFGQSNFVNDIARIKSNPKNFGRKAFGNERDMVLIYSKNSQRNIFNDVTLPLSELDKNRLFPKIDSKGRRYTTVPCHAPGETKNGATGSVWKGQLPPKGRHWRCNPDELTEMDNNGLIEWSKNNVPRIKKFADEHKGKKIQDVWTNYKDPQYSKYPTEKNVEMLEMIIKQSSNENSIIMDCFAGSGTTLIAAERLGRRWIGIDESPASISVVKERLKDVEYRFIEIGDTGSVEVAMAPRIQQLRLRL